MGLKEKMSSVMTQEDMMKLLDSCYQKALEGVEKVSPSIENMANSYLDKNPEPSKAAKAMIKNQIVKCTTSGFVSGLGGVITMPVAIPANIGSVIYVQMRMIACTAYMAGYDLESDEVQTLVHACLAGVAVSELVKKTTVKVGEKVATGMIKKIPGAVLTKINQKVGFRLVTKFGQKGAVNLGKMVPGVGAVIGGGLDFAGTKIIGDRAYKWFFEGDFSVKEEKNTEDDIIDIMDFEEK